MTQTNSSTTKSIINGSQLIIESCACSGADVFVGYPITPANLLYLYASQRIASVYSAPDEITTLQIMAGFSAVGKFPITATSFPGFALMIESINMAYMMELPMLIILAQRLGPATGSATCGAQGDIALIHGMISGGYPIPCLCISNFEDCWSLTNRAIKTANDLRTPVVLLTSKEMIMTLKSFDTSRLEPLKKETTNDISFASQTTVFESYAPSENGVCQSLPLGNDFFQVRMTASTHDRNGDLQNTSIQGLQNTLRLGKKITHNLSSYELFELEEQNSDTLIIAFDITAEAAREAVKHLRAQGKQISLFIPKTLFPIPLNYWDIFRPYKKILIVEENSTGQYRTLLFGMSPSLTCKGINAIGRLITPQEIITGVETL